MIVLKIILHLAKVNVPIYFSPQGLVQVAKVEGFVT